MFHREVFDFKYLNLFLNILNKNRIEFLVLMGRIVGYVRWENQTIP